MQFKKQEIHTVFLCFLNFYLGQNLSASALADLIRASLKTTLLFSRTGGLLLFFAEDQQLADEIIQDDHEHSGDDLDEIFIESEPGEEDGHQYLLQQQSKHSAAREGDDLAHDGSEAAALAFEDPNAVGDISKSNGGGPSDDIGAVDQPRGRLNGIAPKIIE